MTRLKASLGVLIACAACFAAFGASSASAVTLHECKEAVGTGVKYTNSECTTVGEGKFQTVPIEAGTKVKATGTEPFKMTASPLGIATEITCTAMTSEGATATNGLNGEGKMRVTGGASVTSFTGCEMKKPVGCTVPANIKTKEITSETIDTATTMRTKYVPKEGTAFTSFVVSNCGLLNGEKTVNGTASSETETVKQQKFDGTTGSALTFAGAAATLVGKYTLAMEGGSTLALETP